MSVTHFFNGSADVKSRFSRSSDFRALRSALYRPLAGDMETFGLFQEKRLIHADPPIGVAAFVL